MHIEQVTADRKTYDAASDLRLPPLVRDLEIDYTALSFVAPEKNRFRVKLEGRDPDWQDVGNRRQAFYADLSPGTYRFRVTASNNSGVWNEAGAFLDFSIAPAYYQTTWFRAASVVTVLALFWALYQFRLRQIAHDFNLRLDERVNERTRIARELHDTLLQSFQGLMLRFQSARDLLPAHPAKAVEALDGALDRADQAIVEGRDAIQNLRSSTTVTNELAQAMTALAEELRSRTGRRTELGDVPRVRRGHAAGPASDPPRRHLPHCARGAAQCVPPRTGQTKSKPRSPTANVIFGCVSGTMERASTRSTWTRDAPDTGVCPACASAPQQIGAQLNLWSEVGAGTEVELRIPGSVAYGTSRGRGGCSAIPQARTRLMSADRAPIRILSVDDHPLLREGVAALLASQPDMKLVAEASNGREAIEQFRKHRPDVTLMDLQMPEMNGVDAMIAICGEFPRARIIVLTTYAGDVQVLRALKAGARAYLLKSVLRKELLETIRLVHAGQKRIVPEVATELAEHATDDALSPREIEVLRLIASGNANKEIAGQLSITEETVKGHVKNILAKLAANDRTHAVTIGLKRGIIEL